MIIRLDSKLFTVEPDMRFSFEQRLPIGFWNDLWRRYKLLGYTPKELTEFFTLKSGKPTRSQTINRWIFKTEIYYKAQPFVKKGAKCASTEIFGNLENELIDELTKQYRSGVQHKNRIII